MEISRALRQRRWSLEGNDLMIDGISVRDLTPLGVVLICAMLVFLGYLVPRYIYKEKKEEASYWRKAYETSELSRQLSDSQKMELLELAKTTNAIVVATLGTAERLRETSVERRRFRGLRAAEILRQGGADVASTEPK